MALSWDIVFLKMAKDISLRSKDPSTQVGAVLVSPDNRQISCGYNGFPPCVDDVEDVLAKKCDMISNDAFLKTSKENHVLVGSGCGLNKYDLVIHAEENAIINCHVRPTCWTIYCTHHPCASCAKMIIGSGITKVVCKKAKGASDLGYDKAAMIFKIAGINFVEV